MGRRHNAFIGASVLAVALHAAALAVIVQAGREGKGGAPAAVIDLRLLAPQGHGHGKKAILSKHIPLSAPSVANEAITNTPEIPQTTASEETNDSYETESTVSASATAEGSGSPWAGAGISESELAGLAEKAYIEINYDQITDSIMKRIVYPQSARRQGIEGRVVVAFKIDKDGRAANVGVVESSGAGMLDENAVKAVTLASPFPAPGVEASVIVPVVYKLKKDEN